MTRLTPNEARALATTLEIDDFDIVYISNGVLCVCNTECDKNNIAVEKIDDEATPREVINGILTFIVILYLQFNIDYVTIYESRLWRLLKRYKTYSDGKLHAAKISENLIKLVTEIEKIRENL